MWVKNSSGHARLCHKCSPSSEPVQAHLWIVGSLERHTLDSATKSFNAWTVTLRLSQERNRSLDALLKTGPLKSYDPPNRYSVLKIKASFDSVQEGDDDEEFLSTTSPFPFMYDGSCLVEGQSRVPEPCDVSMFSAQSLVAVESPSSGTRGWETGILLTPLEFAAFITSASFLRRPRRLRGNGKGAVSLVPGDRRAPVSCLTLPASPNSSRLGTLPSIAYPFSCLSNPLTGR